VEVLETLLAEFGSGVEAATEAELERVLPGVTSPETVVEKLKAAEVLGVSDPRVQVRGRPPRRRSLRRRGCRPG